MSENRRTILLCIVSLLCGVLIGGVTVGLIAERRKQESTESVAAAEEIQTDEWETESFVFTDTTRIFINDNGVEKEITELVTNYSSGELYVTEDGISQIFGYQVRKTEDEDNQFFAEAMKICGYTPSPQPCTVFEKGTDKLVMQEGNRYYLLNDTVRDLGSAVLRTEEGNLSIPISYLGLALGYAGIDSKAEKDTITYTLRRN